MTASTSSTEAIRKAASSPATRFFRVACWIPLLTFVSVIGFAIIAAIRVGHWPYYSNPDPKDLRLPLLHGAALLSYPVALLTIPICLGVVFLGWGALKRRDVLVFTVGAAGWAFMFPIIGRLFEWLVD